jgi:predicted alpha/beta-fold hydrolase
MLGGGHRQTLFGHLARSRLRWGFPTEDAVVDAPDDIRLLLRVSLQAGQHEDRPAVLLVHGLEGLDDSGYLLSAGELAYRASYHVVRMNLRGCGDALTVCPRLYNAGVSRDLLAVLEWLSSQVRRVGVIGFSLGGNLALLTLARHRERIPPAVAAVAAISPPLDLVASADSIDLPHNYIYRRYFLGRLRASYRRRQRLLPALYRLGAEKGCSTLWEYDEVITAPYAGFRGARDYYSQSSAGPHLSELDRPALILAAEDDPIIPNESVRRWPLSPTVVREITPSGGHVGFVGRSRAPGYFWAAERAVAFIQTQLPIPTAD